VSPRAAERVTRMTEKSEAAMTRALATLARAEAQLRQLRRPGPSK